MAFEPKNWRNYPSTSTPISAEELNRIEEGVSDLTYMKRPPSGVSADDMRHRDYSGEYRVLRDEASAMGIPDPDHGIFRVAHISGGSENGHVIQIWTTRFGNTWLRYILAGDGRDWIEWSKDVGQLETDLEDLGSEVNDLTYMKRPPSGLTADDMRHRDYSGEYRVLRDEAEILGVPEPDHGVFRIVHISGGSENGHVLQTWMTRLGNTWLRYIRAGDGQDWVEWSKDVGQLETDFEDLGSDLEDLGSELEKMEKSIGEYNTELETSLDELNTSLKLTVEKTKKIQDGLEGSFRIRDVSGQVAFEVGPKGEVSFGGAEYKATDTSYRIIDKTGAVALQIDESGKTYIYDTDIKTTHQSDKAPRTMSDYKFQPNEPEQTSWYPSDMNPWDRTSMLNHNSSMLRYSPDEGKTWELIHTFDDPVRSLKFIENGEVLLATKGSGTDKHTDIFRSVGFEEDPHTAEWVKTLTMETPGAYPSAAFSWSHHKNMILVSEYGPKRGVSGGTENAKYVYMSRNYGKTWEAVFNLEEDAPGLYTDSGIHNHGVLYDPYWDRIWVTYGDGATGATDTVFSDDLGESWHTVGLLHSTPYSYQSVGMIALPSCVLLATDGSPNGVLRIDRSQGKHTGTYEVESAYRYDYVQGLTILCQSVWQAKRPGNDAPVVFEFCSAPGEGPRFILTTMDGYKFNKVWESDVVRGNSSGKAFGPTVSGRLLHYAVDEYFTPGGRTLRQGPMPSAY